VEVKISHNGMHFESKRGKYFNGKIVLVYRLVYVSTGTVESSIKSQKTKHLTYSFSPEPSTVSKSGGTIVTVDNLVHQNLVSKSEFIF